MVGRFILRILQNLSSNEKLVDKLAESKAIKRAAQLTAYTITKGQKSFQEFQKSGGLNKMKEVTESDLKDATKAVKEFVSYDLPKTTSKALRKILENMRKN